MISTESEILNKKNQSDPYTEENELFPVFLKLSELHTLIVGGGSVGLEKLTAVLKNSPKAEVTVVAPSLKNEIINLAENFPNIKIQKRKFLPEDLNDKDLVIAATNNRILNKGIKEEAKSRKILTNVADTPDLCDYYLSSIVQKGSIKLAISTNGKSPTVAKRLKEILNTAIPDEMEDVLDNLVQIRSRLNGNFSEKVKELNKITSVLVEETVLKPKKKINIKFIFLGIAASLFFMIAGHFIFQNISFTFFESLLKSLNSSSGIGFHWFVLAGFIAQLIDGALGMAYGVSATTFLLTIGIPPAAASASVHTSEIFTSGVSGLSHLKFGNVSTKLFKKIVFPGVLGALLGAVVLSSLAEYNFIVKPVIASYTLILGIIIISKAVKNKKQKGKIKFIRPLAGAGGFLDAVGGGGWGPVVSSTLIAKGKHPLTTIGSVNLAEFFVALTSSAAFVAFIGITHWQIILGLILGGVIAAPFAAKAAGKLPLKTMMILVGFLVVIVSLRIIYTMLF